MKNNWKVTCFFAGLFCVFGLTAPIGGQGQEVRDQAQYDASVTLKLIQVFVSGKDGNPVMDLTADDFILSDNGKAMKITDFEVHRIQSSASDHAAELADQSEIPSNRPSDMNRKFYFILDGYRNDGLGLKKARTTALHFIDTRVRIQDELSLMSYSISRGLVLHEPLTTDHDLIREAVNTVKLFPGMTSTGAGGSTAMEEALDFTEYMNDFAVSLRYIPGYKHLILFSAGLPRSLFGADDPRLHFEYERLAKELSSSSCPFYTIDTQGGRDSVEGREQRGDDSLRRLADLTGGRHFPNVDYREDLSEDIQNSTGNYYVLGYGIQESWDGKYHEIKVKVTRKGTQVQAQKGYYNPKRFAKFSKLEKRLHLLDLARNPVPLFQVPLKMAAFPALWPSGEAGAALCLAEITSPDMDEIIADKAEFFSLVYDNEGVLIEEGSEEVDFTKNPPDRITAYSIFKQQPGEYEIITILRNTKTGEAARAAASMLISEAEGSPDKDGGLILFIPGGESSCLRIELKPVKGKSKTKGLTLESLVPENIGPVSPLVAEMRAGTNVIYGVVRLGPEINDPLEIDLISRLRSIETGDNFPLSGAILDESPSGEADAAAFKLDLPLVPPGRYVLEISFAGGGQADVRMHSREIVVR